MVTWLVSTVTLCSTAVPPLKSSSATKGAMPPAPEVLPAEIWKTGVPPPPAACTTKVAEVLWLRLPLVPVTEIVKVPVDVEPVVETVRVELPDVMIEAGLKLSVAPLGSALALRLTVPLKPLEEPMLTVYDALLPCVTVVELGLMEMVKSGDPPPVGVALA